MDELFHSPASSRISPGLLSNNFLRKYKNPRPKKVIPKNPHVCKKVDEYLLLGSAFSITIPIPMKIAEIKTPSKIDDFLVGIIIGSFSFMKYGHHRFMGLWLYQK